MPASLRLLCPEVLRHGKIALPPRRTSVFLLRKARRSLGSPKPGSPTSVKYSYSVCGATSPLPALANPENLSVLMRRRRLYHGGSWCVSIAVVQLYDKQYTKAPVYVQRVIQKRKRFTYVQLLIQEGLLFAFVNGAVICEQVETR